MAEQGHIIVPVYFGQQFQRDLLAAQRAAQRVAEKQGARLVGNPEVLPPATTVTTTDGQFVYGSTGVQLFRFAMEREADNV